MRGFKWAVVGAVLLVGVGDCTGSGSGSAGFEPVYLEAPDGGLRAEVVGRRDGGFYGDFSSERPPAYDVVRRWLYVVAVPRLSVEVLDIADPARPHLVRRIGYGDFLLALLHGQSGSAEPLEREPRERAAGPIGVVRSVAYADGVLAVAFNAWRRNDRGRVLFLDGAGRAIGASVVVGVKPDMMAFTPDGRTLVVVNAGGGEPGDDPEGSISLVSVEREAGGQVRTGVRQVDFRAFDGEAEALRAQGVRLFMPGSSVAQDLEPESLAIAPDGRTAYVSLVINNALATVDLEAGRVTAIHGLGTRDLNVPGQGIDASDRDGGINIRPWPVHAYYGPDGIGVYPAGGELFVVTANEGDPRELEEAVVGDLVLDPVAFPDAAMLQRPENLGRLRVTGVEGDVDGDGDFDRLYALGTRSFAIWDTKGRLVFDSGDAFERLTAAAMPTVFNAPEDDNAFDGRSKSRGPEPESLALGEVDGRWYAFVAFERIGGVIAYDITEPTAPRFAFYLNNRNLAVDPAAVCRSNWPKSVPCAEAGDLEPEALRFISAAESPNGEALLVVTHEKSDSVTLLQLTPTTGGEGVGMPVS
jgi:2',3'-cyclic-nucleotide 2'-phosphodiesterase / 3'-nucleotidase / 5'-nucleotidase